jgi:hypothetical protein
MAGGSYEVLALIPETSDFSLTRAVQHFAMLRFGQIPLKSEPVHVEGNEEVTGFRVDYGDWSVAAWLEDRPRLLEESPASSGRSGRRLFSAALDLV